MSYIVPRDKPNRCTNCQFMDRITYDCMLMYENYYSDFESQYEHCPLVEIPTPHGRLIDVDGFKQDYGMGNECADCEQKLKGTLKSCEYDRIYSEMDFCQWLDNAETIIEAEGSEE